MGRSRQRRRVRRRAADRRLTSSGERAGNLEESARPSFAPHAGKIEDDGYEDRSLAYQQIVPLALGAQREALLRRRSDCELSNEAVNRILRELDLEESPLEI